MREARSLSDSVVCDAVQSEEQALPAATEICQKACIASKALTAPSEHGTLQRAWRGAASTRAVVALRPCGSQMFVSKRCDADCAAFLSTAATHHKPEHTDELKKDTDDAYLFETAGLKSASHRVRGSSSTSAKAVEKRNAAKEKRQAQAQKNRT